MVAANQNIFPLQRTSFLEAAYLAAILLTSFLIAKAR
jgi:hypothetical protein